jgi:hypothetical protein
MSNANLSYTRCVYFDALASDQVFAADWNIVYSDPDYPDAVSKAEAIYWTHKVHQGRANLLYDDGRVEQYIGGVREFAFGRMWSPGPPPGAGGGGGGGPSGGGDSAASAEPSPGLFGGLEAGNGPAASASTAGRSGPAPSGQNASGRSSGAGVFSQVENALGSRSSARPQSAPPPQTYAATRIQDVVAPAIVALAQTNIARTNSVAANNPASERAIEAPASLPDESIAALQGYVEPKAPGYAWPVFLILLLVVLIIELMRRHRHRRRRRFVQHGISA